MSERARIAVVGAGLIGRVHLAALAASARCSPCAVVDPDAAAGTLAASLGVPRYRSLDALLERERPDGVIVATPNALHVGHALVCVERDLPVLVEKPLAPSVSEAAPLVAAAAARGARVLVGHHRAHSPIMRRARETIASGALGQLVAVDGSATFCKPDDYFAAAPWRNVPGEGGPVLINMIHDVHALRTLCGDIVAVQAVASSAVRGLAVEDTVAMTFRFANGALGSFLLSDCAASAASWEQTSGENPAYARADDVDCYNVRGALGSLAIPTLRLTRYPDAASRSWWKPFLRETLSVAREDPIALQIEHFGAVVRGEAEPLVTLADGVANLAVVEAIVRAARTGGTVAPEAEASVS